MKSVSELHLVQSKVITACRRLLTVFFCKKKINTLERKHGTNRVFIDFTVQGRAFFSYLWYKEIMFFSTRS